MERGELRHLGLIKNTGTRMGRQAFIDLRSTPLTTADVILIDPTQEDKLEEAWKLTHEILILKGNWNDELGGRHVTQKACTARDRGFSGG